MSRAIRPDQITEYKQRSIPDEVFEAVNELIATNYVAKSKSIIIKQKEIMANTRKKMYPDNDFDVKGFFNIKWLNFEEVYEEAGWDVRYDKPSFNESYDAYFEFTVKNKN